MKTIYVDQKEEAWYRTEWSIPDEMSTEEFIQIYNSQYYDLEEKGCTNDTGWYVDNSSYPLSLEENHGQATLEFREDSSDSTPVWTNEIEDYLSESDKIALLHIDLISALEEYIELLGKELSDLGGIMLVRGWQSTRVEEGKLLREKIQSIKDQIK